MTELQSSDAVTDIWLIVQTDTGDNAGSKAYLELGVTPSLQPAIELDTLSQQNSANSLSTPGAPALFHWQQGTTNWNLTLANLSHIDLEIEGNYSDDVWLPSSIWIIFGTSQAQILIVSYPSWGYNCFSSQSSDCGGKALPSYTLYPPPSGVSSTP